MYNRIFELLHWSSTRDEPQLLVALWGLRAAIFRVGSKISQTGTQTYCLAIFPEKLHENEEVPTKSGTRVPCVTPHPPINQPMNYKILLTFNLVHGLCNLRGPHSM